MPAHSAATFLVRAGRTNTLKSSRERVLNCFRGAATATGARLEYRWDEDQYEAP